MIYLGLNLIKSSFENIMRNNSLTQSNPINVSGWRNKSSVTWPLCRGRVGSYVFFDAFCAKTFPLTEQQALVHHPCKLVCLCLAAAKPTTERKNCELRPKHDVEKAD